MSSWEYTDDPAAPCPYCVQWEGPDDDPESWVPMMPDGPVSRIRRRVCESCDRAIAEYTAQSDRMPR